MVDQGYSEDGNQGKEEQNVSITILVMNIQNIGTTSRIPKSPTVGVGTRTFHIQNRARYSEKNSSRQDITVVLEWDKRQKKAYTGNGRTRKREQVEKQVMCVCV